MRLAQILLAIFGTVFFLLATIGVAVPRISWFNAGILCWFLLYVLPILAEIAKS